MIHTRRHKILMLTHSSCKTGGSEDDFVRLLKKLKDSFYIVSIFPDGERVELFRSLSDISLIIPNRVFPIDKFNIRKYAAFIVYSLIKLIYILPFLWKNRDIEICYINSSVSFFDGIIIKLFRIAVVVSIKEKIYPDFIGKLVYKTINTISDKIIVISDFLKKEFFRSTKSDRAIIIHSSIESEHYLDIAKNEIDDLDNSYKRVEFVVLNIGNIYEIKGTEVILNAAARIPKSENIKIEIIGTVNSQDYYKKLLKLVKELKLEGIVEFMGGLEKDLLIKEIIRSDIIVITSKVEGQSIVLLEALLLEKPVITTSVGVVPDVIVDGVNGLIYDYGDGKKLSELILLLKNNKELYMKIVTNSQRTFYDKFDLEDSLNKYYVEILDTIKQQGKQNYLW